MTPQEKHTAADRIRSQKHDLEDALRDLKNQSKERELYSIRDQSKFLNPSNYSGDFAGFVANANVEMIGAIEKELSRLEKEYNSLLS